MISLISGLDNGLARPTEWTSVTIKWFWDCHLLGRYNHGVGKTASTWHVTGCSVFGLLCWCPIFKWSYSFEDRASQIEPVRKFACIFDNLSMLITEKTTELHISGPPSVREIHRRPVDSLHTGPVMRIAFMLWRHRSRRMSVKVWLSASCEWNIDWFHVCTQLVPCNMMTSSNGNIFCAAGHLCGEFTGPRWIPRTKASDAELWCFLWSASE